MMCFPSTQAAIWSRNNLHTLAVGYNCADICVWGIGNCEGGSASLYDWITHSDDCIPTDIVFRPHDTTETLAVAYDNVDLYFYAVSKLFPGCISQLSRASVAGSDKILLTCSSDGKSLFSIGLQGCIYVWNFSTGGIVHKVKKGLTDASILRASPDGKHILAISGHRSQIWEPSRDQEEPQINFALGSPNLEQGLRPLDLIEESQKKIGITCVDVHPDAPLVVFRRRNGEVIAFNTRRGEFVGTIRRASNESVTALSLSKNFTVAIGYESGMVCIK
ncbi:putative NACHT and WD domain protein [Seiridium cardinale]